MKNITVELTEAVLLAGLKTALLIVATVATVAQAEPRYSQRNYILGRQQVVPGLGTPTTRLIYGKREIDIYRNGLMFDRDHVVDVRQKAN